MATRQYIGARYVPLHRGEWGAQTQYEPLDVVMYTDGNSYTAKCTPPKGTVPTNEEYWALSAQFNQQLASLTDDISRLEKYEGGFINFKAFGGSPDNDDNSPIMVTAITQCASAGKGLFIDSGEYIFKSQITVPLGFKILGVEKNFVGNYGTVFKKMFNGDFLICNSYTEISGVSIEGEGFTGAGVVLGGRTYLHDVFLNNCEKGIICGSASCNLARIARVTVIGCMWAVYLDNTNSLNAQSISFYDIDIRECEHALYLNQPSNKFYNFCSQVMRGEGPAVKMGENAKNNIFYGSYFESGYSNGIEVDLTGAQYNKFTGCRITQYVTAFANNDGTNIIEARTIQNAAVNFVSGSQMFDEVTLCTKYHEGMPASGVKLVKGDSDGIMLVKPDGTSGAQVVKFDNVIFDNDTFKIGTLGGIQGGSFEEKFTSFQNQNFSHFFTSRVPTGYNLIVQAGRKGVGVNVEAGPENYMVHVFNYSGEDLSNTTIPFNWIAFKVN